MEILKLSITELVNKENELSENLVLNKNKKDAMILLKRMCFTALKMEEDKSFRDILIKQNSSIESLCSFINSCL